MITRKDQGGFTIIETSIALVLMMIVSVGLAPLFVYASRYNSAAAIRAGALAIAQIKLEQLRATSFSSCVSSNETLSVGDPATGLQTYTVEMTVVNTTTTLKDVKLVVTPNARSTTGPQYGGTRGWMYGQVTIYTKRTAITPGPNLG
ncbi:MAG TPA: prepilin-type N-terminal cleavage/methylation domain-containing protein [Pyrinomonadaceae bacterium]|nr:prepilin-type N-terminal cleavage/methylation domain-containing protein [Pyrinomonadaceae bacterium]